jgi:hypothetical protein
VWTALIAFVGGVAAVALKGYVDYIFERRRERRERQLAARLVYDELWSASTGIEASFFGRRIPSEEDFPTTAWNEHNRALISAALDFEHWRLVVYGYDSVAEAREMCERERRRHPDNNDLPLSERRLDDRFAEGLDERRASIASAREIVGRLIRGVEWDPFPAHDEAYNADAKRYDRRRRRGRLMRKLAVRWRYWFGRGKYSRRVEERQQREDSQRPHSPE